MMDSPEDRRTQLSPQLAMRVAILGGIAFAIFGIIFFRLWFLQVLSGDQYVAEASSNRIRRITIQAPRGELTDRNGMVLVENRNAVSVVVSPTGLPEDDEAAQHDVFVRLSRVLRRSLRPIRCAFGSGRRTTYESYIPLECRVRQSMGALPYANVVVEPDAPQGVYTYLAEHAQEFPGVEIQDAWVREYPFGTLGAHLFGTVGQITEEQLRDEHFRGARGGTVVGQTGLEYTYDGYLRGQDGSQRIQVDANGRARRALVPVEPRKGNDVELSLDGRLQRAGEQALRTGIGLAQGNGNPANGGAFVALDPRDGAVLAMGSYPSFDPNLFARPISQRTYDALTSEERNFPLLNRAIQSGFALGSTFKPVTAAAALATGKTSVGETYVDTGTWRSGAQVRRNAGGAVFGPVSLIRALAVSVDTYFYTLGERLNVPPEGHPRGGPLQEWARKFGFGRRTGIDLPSEEPGTVPDPAFGRELQAAERRCRQRRRVESCGLALLDDTWTVGDNVSFAIGQGDFLATPLQLAVSYAAIENGGTIVTPHLGMTVRDADGRVVDRISPRPAGHVEIPELDSIRQGLLDSTTIGEGTATDVFEGFGRPVYGKTGTAQITNRPDQSWFVAYVPDQERPIVVAALVQNGGFGAEAAAPAVRQILSQWFYGTKGEAVSGGSATY